MRAFHFTCDILFIWDFGNGVGSRRVILLLIEVWGLGKHPD